LLEYPHYTRPATFRDWDVPAVLRSGDHGRILRWRHAQALHRTLLERPELAGESGIAERALLEEIPAVAYPSWSLPNDPEERAP
jgi:tRNA (guanine-N1)-methyltransferase